MADFYFEDDDENVGMSQDDQNFNCKLCGGTEGYYDEDGNLCCIQCFTQSQDVLQTQENMDVDDVALVAVKTKGGHFRGRRAHRKKAKVSRKLPLEDLNNSRRLPDLNTCIRGFQNVLREAVSHVGTIMELTVDEKRHLMKSVRTIWMAYLRAWSDGAETYGKLFPDIRFSLRDSFLSESRHTGVLLRVLSHNATKAVAEEADGGNPKQNRANIDDDLSSVDIPSTEDSDDDRNNSDISVHYTRNALDEADGVRKLKHQSFQNLYRVQQSFRRKGREEAALSLPPSMKLVASLLLLPTSRMGITPGQMINWIKNGSLPLFNAFQQMLSKEKRDELQPIDYFFKMKAPPSPYNLESQTALLAVSAGLKSHDHLRFGTHFNLQKQAPPNSKITTAIGRKNPNGIQKRLQFVSLDCLPNALAQIVADLGFGQRVLDIALSLIGVQPPSQGHFESAENATFAEQWLPGPLSRAHPDQLQTPEQLCAVIVVACKMCKGWEEWTYVQQSPAPDRPSLLRNISKREPTFDWNGSDEESMATEETGEKISLRFVAWNDDQFRLIKHGRSMEDYVDFVETVGLNHEDFQSCFDDVTSRLENPTDEANSRNKESIRDNTLMLPVRPSSHLDGGRSMQGTANKVRFHPGANEGWSPYFVYSDPSTHNRKMRLTPDPFHLCYARLVEYVSYKMNVGASLIHELVTKLDEEVLSLCIQPERKRRRKTLPPKQEDTNIQEQSKADSNVGTLHASIDCDRSDMVFVSF